MIRAVILFVGLVIVLNLAWRWASRRRNVPCPGWLAWGLENGLMVRILGTGKALARIGLKPGQRVLELGPGPGRLLIPAARMVRPSGQAVGVDIQRGMIRRLTTRTARAGVANVAALVGSAGALPFAAGSFDVIILALTLGEIPDRAAGLRQCREALRPGGILSITEFFPDPALCPAAGRAAPGSVGRVPSPRDKGTLVSLHVELRANLSSIC